MPTPERLAEQFEEHGAYLRAVAYPMLGSASEAEDAVQEGWIRLGRTDVHDVENLRAWLTTVVARVCLDMLRTRTSRREDPLDENATHVSDPMITSAGEDPESDAMLADSVGLALLVVLETLEPAERLAICAARCSRGAACPISLSWSTAILGLCHAAPTAACLR